MLYSGFNPDRHNLCASVTSSDGESFELKCTIINIKERYYSIVLNARKFVFKVEMSNKYRCIKVICYIHKDFLNKEDDEDESQTLIESIKFDLKKGLYQKYSERELDIENGEFYESSLLDINEGSVIMNLKFDITSINNKYNKYKYAFVLTIV